MATTAEIGRCNETGEMPDIDGMREVGERQRRIFTTTLNERTGRSVHETERAYDITEEDEPTWFRRAGR